jgi:uncharacterized caspase-like protein
MQDRDAVNLDPNGDPIMPHEDRALVVGIDHYPGFNDNLEGAVNDADAFCAWLKDSNGGNVPECHCIKSTDYLASAGTPLLARQARPVAEEIHDYIARLQDEADDRRTKRRSCRLGRRIYLYFAGHGFDVDWKEPALLMANATPLRLGYHILGRYLADWLLRAGYFDEILLFMDCCREIRQVPALNKPFAVESDAQRQERVKWFYAFGAKSSRATREYVTETGKAQGIFTSALIAGLNGAAAAPGTDSITAKSLSRYLDAEMINYMRPDDRNDSRLPKTPDVDFEPRYDDWVILQTPPKLASVAIHPAAFTSVAIHPAAFTARRIEVLGGDSKVIAAVASSPACWHVQLPHGYYKVRIPDVGKQKLFEVSGREVVHVHF